MSTISENLLSAYRWNRQRFPHHKALLALSNARHDVANGKARYPHEKAYPAVTWQPVENPRSSERLAYVENPAAAGLREVGRVMPECGGRNGYWDTRGDCGWHTDPYGDTCKDGSGLCYGLVFQLPGRNGKARFVAGYQFGGVDGGPVVDFGTVYESDPMAYADFYGSVCDHDDAIDAARAADSMAQSAAEDEREYQTAWQAGSRYADLGREIADDRATALALLSERRAARKIDPAAFPAICNTIRSRVRDILHSIEDAREKREKLKSGDFRDLYFYPGETRLKDAFNEGAGETVLV